MNNQSSNIVNINHGIIKNTKISSNIQKLQFSPNLIPQKID